MIDFRNNESLEIIDLLCKSIESNADEKIKLSYLISLRYIFQEIKPNDLSNDYINQCLKIIFYIIQNHNNEFIILESLNCLQYAIPFLKNIFKNEVYK